MTMVPEPEPGQGQVVYRAGRMGIDKRLHLSPKLNLPFKSVNEVWTIYGKRGSGKSYFLGKLCEELNRLGIPFLIIDVKNAHEYINLQGVRHIHMDKIKPANLVNTLGRGQSVILSMKGMDIDQMRVYVTELCNTLNKARFGKRFKHAVMVAFEECHNFIGQGAGSAGGEGKIRSQCLSAVDKLIREGRQDGVGAILISQSVANVLASIRRQAEMKIVFNIKDHTDIKNLENMLIGKTKKDVLHVIDKIYHFDIGEFACISPLYIRDPGIITDKTAPRITRHAGRSFIEDDSSPMLPGSGGIYPDMLPEPIEILPEPGDPVPEEAKDEPELAYGSDDSSVPGVKLIKYKSALTIGLVVLSAMGIAFVVLKKYMEKKEFEKELVMEDRYRQEQQKLIAIQDQHNAQETSSDDHVSPIPAMPGQEEPSIFDNIFHMDNMPPDVRAELSYHPHSSDEFPA